jgi:hypothetical protein
MTSCPATVLAPTFVSHDANAAPLVKLSTTLPTSGSWVAVVPVR